MLSTSFDHIPDHQYGERIKALQQMIGKQLTSLSYKAASTRLEHEKINEWYEAELANIIHGQPSRARFEMQMALMEAPLFNIKYLAQRPSDEHADLFDELKNFMRRMPRKNIFNMLTGQIHPNQQVFLEELCLMGDNLISKAQARNIEKENFPKISPEMRKDAFCAREFYRDFAQAVQAGNAGFALDALLKLRGNPSPIGNRLLSMPLKGHPVALLAFASLAGREYNADQLIVRFIDTIPSRAAALEFMDEALHLAKDEGLAAKISNYRDQIQTAKPKQGKIGREFADSAARSDSFDTAMLMRVADSSRSLSERYAAQGVFEGFEKRGAGFSGGAGKKSNPSIILESHDSPASHHSAAGDSSSCDSGGGGSCDISADPCLDNGSKARHSHNPFRLRFD